MFRILLILQTLFFTAHAADDHQREQNRPPVLERITFKEDIVAQVSFATAIIPSLCVMGAFLGANSIEECYTYAAIFAVSYLTSRITQLYMTTTDTWVKPALYTLRGISAFGAFAFIKTHPRSILQKNVEIPVQVCSCSLPEPEPIDDSSIFRIFNCTAPSPHEMGAKISQWFSQEYIDKATHECRMEAMAQNKFYIFDNKILSTSPIATRDYALHLGHHNIEGNPFHTIGENTAKRAIRAARKAGMKIEVIKYLVAQFKKDAAAFIEKIVIPTVQRRVAM